jgi:hypothetical protein
MATMSSYYSDNANPDTWDYDYEDGRRRRARRYDNWTLLA